MLTLFCCFKTKKEISKEVPKKMETKHSLEKKEVAEESKAKYNPVLYNSELYFDTVEQYDAVFPISKPQPTSADNDDIELELTGLVPSDQALEEEQEEEQKMPNKALLKR